MTTMLLPKGFPDLFGCRSHRPRSVELLPWTEPLDERWPSRRTAAAGLGWTMAVDRPADDRDVVTVLIDCTWASNALRAIGLSLAATPLVAVQTWADSSALARADGCVRCEERLRGLDAVLMQHWGADEELDDSHRPPFPRLRWKDDPRTIADAVLTDLRARSVMGEALLSLSGRADWDVIPKADVYLQFHFGLEGQLAIEARKDFQYWRTEVPDHLVTKLSAAGFSVDTSPIVFEMLLGPDPHDIIHRDAVESAVRAFVDVYEPRRGRIEVFRSEGATHLEGSIAPDVHAEARRRIDRGGWPDTLQLAEERLDGAFPRGAPTVFDLLIDHGRAYADYVAFAHMDEYVDRYDDLTLLVPIDDEALVDAVDELASPEELVTFVLRHAFRWSDQRAMAVADGDEERDPEVIVIETLSRDRYRARLRDGELVEIAGRRVDAVPEGTARNGCYSLLHGRLDPPEPAPLLVPRFD